MLKFILQLPSRLCITGPKILAKLHATVWEFWEQFSVNVRESIARRYIRPPRAPRPAVPLHSRMAWHGIASVSGRPTITQCHAGNNHIISMKESRDEFEKNRYSKRCNLQEEADLSRSTSLWK